MKTQKLACLAMLALFLTLGAASGWFVYRRAPWPWAAAIGGIVGAILLYLPIGFLMAIPGRVAEWWLILRARLGAEPRHGRRVALIGTIRANGELRTPFTNKRCVLYEYELHTIEHVDGESETRKSYDGFAMLPLTIEHGAERTRLLAKPELKLEEKQPRGKETEENALAYLRSTTFTPPPAPGADPPDLTHTDGRLRVDHKHPGAMDVLGVTRFVEKKLPPDASVCAIGTYNAERRALVGPLKLTLGETSVIDAAWRVVNAAIAAVVFAVIALAAALIFCVNYPLDGAEQVKPEWTFTWPEIEFERLIHKHVRQESGTYIREVCEGCAVGKLEVEGRMIDLRHAVPRGDGTIHLAATPTSSDGITLLDREHLSLTIDGRTAGVPDSWLQPGDVATFLDSHGVREGRITIIAPDRSIRCRVTFKARQRMASMP